MKNQNKNRFTRRKNMVYRLGKEVRRGKQKKTSLTAHESRECESISEFRNWETSHSAIHRHTHSYRWTTQGSQSKKSDSHRNVDTTQHSLILLSPTDGRTVLRNRFDSHRVSVFPWYMRIRWGLPVSLLYSYSLLPLPDFTISRQVRRGEPFTMQLLYPSFSFRRFSLLFLAGRITFPGGVAGGEGKKKHKKKRKKSRKEVDHFLLSRGEKRERVVHSSLAIVEINHRKESRTNLIVTFALMLSERRGRE